MICNDLFVYLDADISQQEAIQKGVGFTKNSNWEQTERRKRKKRRRKEVESMNYTFQASSSLFKPLHPSSSHFHHPGRHSSIAYYIFHCLLPSAIHLEAYINLVLSLSNRVTVVHGDAGFPK